MHEQGFCRKTEPVGDIDWGGGVGCGERERATAKELAYKLMEVGKSEIFRVGREAGDPGKT